MLLTRFAVVKKWLQKHGVSRSHLVKLKRVAFPRYTRFCTTTGLMFERLGIPTTVFDLSKQPVIHTCDFLPDSVSFSGTPFSDSPYVEFARSYYKESAFDYQATRYFRLAKKGYLPFPCSGAKAAHERCQQFMLLCDEIKARGYLPGSYEPITFVACRDGNYMVINGKHRLACLVALHQNAFDAIICHPNEVRVMFRDQAASCWPRRFYRQSLSTLAKVGASPLPGVDDVIQLIKRSSLETQADIYHPIPFEGFEQLSTQVCWNTPYQRLAMILKGCQDFSQARILDLGANVGFYSFSLARRGANVTAVDMRPEYASIARQIASLYNISLEFICSPINIEFLRSLQPKYDLTLLFSVFQWIVDQEGWATAISILQEIAKISESMFFDVAVNDGKACLHSYPGGEKIYIERFLRQSTGFKYVAHVGDVHPYKRDTRHVFFCTHRRPAD